MLRHGANTAVTRTLGMEFPWGIFLVNITGCFMMGLIAGWLAFRTQHGWSQDVRLLLTTGMLGGYTTFSAFSLDVVVMIERKAYTGALGYALASVIASAAAPIPGPATVSSTPEPKRLVCANRKSP